MRTYIMQEQQRRREARLFIAGFWCGLVPGLLVALACVVLALWLRG